MLRFAVVVAMFACSHPGPAPSAPVPPPPTTSGAPDCAATSANVARVLAAETTKVHEVAAAVERHCRDDGWVAEARSCIAAAADHAAAHACAHDQLSGIQYDRVVGEISALIPHHPPDTESSGGGTQAEIAARLAGEGKTLMYANQFAAASAKFREAAAHVPDPRYFFDLCAALYQEGKFAEALSACNAADSNNPTAELHAKVGKLGEVIKTEAAKQSVQLHH
jgi:hypothetical protein